MDTMYWLPYWDGCHSNYWVSYSRLERMEAAKTEKRGYNWAVWKTNSKFHG